MRHALTLHPDSRCAAVSRIEAEVARPRPGVLALTYHVAGRIGAVCLPAAAAASRVDGLWKHTCFEAFLRDGDGPGYHEFNFAPSTQWAAYSFDGYRAGMRNADAFGAPRIDVRADEDWLDLSVELDIPDDMTGRLGLTAVIEDMDGAISYWALAHPPGRADFHDPAGFVLNLPLTDPT